MKEPVAAPLLAKLTVPAGADLSPEPVSETTAVQLTESLIGVVAGVQVTLVEVVRLVTVRLKPVVSALSAWMPSVAV